MTRSFEYLRPDSIEEAVAMKAEHGDRARFWAGGTDMMLLFKRKKLDLDFCIDLSHIADLRYIDEEDGALRIGAMATLDDLDRASGINAATAALGETSRMMCTKQSRTIATVGGNMCHASPSADLSPPLTALGAQAVIQGPSGERSLPLEQFHKGVNQIDLGDGELLKEIFIPKASGRIAASYNRIARTVVDIALVSSAVCLRLDDGDNIESAGVALGAVAPNVVRVSGAEGVLSGATLEEAANGLAQKAGAESASAARAISDIRASKEYRTDMTAVLTARGVQKCVENLKGLS
ncbi:FAD binding domain-containing protein [Ruegeria atlantica]|uniref:FAD binding domain-containing protein n=1 Tax=Ruegeria atlantica TaxID=81569 RepID=UPI0014817F2F|nr:xanthine dehydrogenase family protein subunit M [Ruegeria atlantica]